MKRICKNCGYIQVSDINVCPACQRNEWEDFEIYQIRKISSEESFVAAMIKLKNDDPIEYQLKLQQFKTQQQEQLQQVSNNTNTTTQNIPHCPTCGSTEIKKISGISKAGSIAMWGIFSRKVHKQWHCNNCGSEW